MKAFPDDLVRDLTKPEILGLLEIMHYSNDAQTQKDFGHILGLVHSTFSFPNILGGVILSTDVDASDLKGWDVTTTQHWLLNESYPEAWLKEYYEQKYYQCDPVAQTIATSFGFTTTWAEMIGVCTPAQRVVFDRAATFGMVHGVTASCFDEDSMWASFMSCAGCAEGEDVRLKPVVSYIVQRLHDSLVVWSRLLRRDGREKFTTQEREVMRWMSVGKTNGEIGSIIGLRERTVKYHVSQLFMKMDVHNRAQLVSEARKLGLLIAV